MMFLCPKCPLGKAKNVTKTIEYVDKTETLDEIVTHSFCKQILWALT